MHHHRPADEPHGNPRLNSCFTLINFLIFHFKIIQSMMKLYILQFDFYLFYDTVFDKILHNRTKRLLFII